MRTTITIEDVLYERTLGVTDPAMDRIYFSREAIKTFIRIQAAKRLVGLGGSTPKMVMITRRNRVEKYRVQIRSTTLAIVDKK